MSRRRPKGYTLVEALVSIVLVGTTLSTITVALHGLFRAEHRIADRLEQDRVLENMAVRLRIDVHDVQSASIDMAEESQATLMLSMPGSRSIRYSFRDGQLDRSVHMGDELSHHDSFVASGIQAAKWSLSPAESPTLVLLELVALDRERTKRMAAPIRIQAAIGIHSN